MEPDVIPATMMDHDRGLSGATGVARSALQDLPFPTPTANAAVLWDLGVHGVPFAQYLRWADDLDVFVGMADEERITRDELVARTPLTARGADAMLGVLGSLGVVQRVGDGYRLGDVGREYLDRRSVFYIGASLYGALAAPLPPQLRKGEPIRRYSTFTGTLRDTWRYLRKPNQFGRREQLLMQHSRNLSAGVAAVRTGHFTGVRHLVDVGGGTGAFAIPLALDRPDIRISLVELPRALPHIRPFLQRHGVSERIALVGLNVHDMPWPLEPCDGVMFGNFLHFCDDDECTALLAESRRMLQPGGRIFLHEMLWNDQQNGPVATALWNFWMATISAGRQRSAPEFAALLRSAGFTEPTVVPTTGGFSLITSLTSSAA